MSELFRDKKAYNEISRFWISYWLGIRGSNYHLCTNSHVLNRYMSDDQSTKLFKYMEEFRADVDKRFDEVKQGHADIRGAVAELGAQLRDYHHEMIFLSHQVDKL